jgi:FAD dependent monooxygenase
MPCGRSRTAHLLPGILTGPTTHSYRLGYPDLTLERREFLQILYDELPDKSKVQTGKKVKHVIDNDDEAGVELADGSIEHADIVVGCDGVHSTVRDSMWANANRSIPGYISKKEQESE